MSSRCSVSSPSRVVLRLPSWSQCAALALAGLLVLPVGAAAQQEEALTCPVPDEERRERPALAELIQRGTTMEEIAQMSQPRATTPRAAMCELKFGNTRFFTGEVRDAALSPIERRALALGQSPHTAVLGCSDSRVPAELVFDQGPGDLFVVRNAGNIASPHAQGSVEYAVRHLKSSLIVVMGHEGCGAVQAAMLSPGERGKEPKHIQQILRDIDPGLKGLPTVRDEVSRDRLTVIANVRQQVTELRQNPVVREAVDRGELQVVGALYKMSSGAVEFFESDEAMQPWD